jgi:hypothetical protein
MGGYNRSETAGVGWACATAGGAGGRVASKEAVLHKLLQNNREGTWGQLVWDDMRTMS